MFINDLHILYYLAFGIIGLIVGQFIDWCNLRMSKYEKIISKDFFKIYLKKFKPKYVLMFITAMEIFPGFIILISMCARTIKSNKYIFII